MTTKGRNTTVDVLRVLAGLMVIGIHTSGEYVLEGVAEGANFIAGLCWEAVVQPAVPIFVIISGAFVLGRNETWGDFYRKRIPRLLVLLAFWLPFYWLWLWLKGDDIGSYLAGFWQGRSFVHLWYVVMLLGLYAVVPLLNEIIRRCEADGEKAARKRLWTLSTILLLLGILSNTYDYILGYNRFFPFLWPDYLGYFLVGYTLKSHAPQRSLPALSLYGLSTISLFFASRYAFEDGEGLYFYRNLSPLVVLSAISLFALFVSWGGCGGKLARIGKMQGDILGIYLVHIAVLNVVTKILVLTTPSLMQCAWLNIPIRVGLVFFVSWGVVRLMKRLPICRYLV